MLSPNLASILETPRRALATHPEAFFYRPYMRTAAHVLIKTCQGDTGATLALHRSRPRPSALTQTPSDAMHDPVKAVVRQYAE